MLWIYYSAQIFFFGAELTHQYALQFGSLRAEVVRAGRREPGQGPQPPTANPVE